MESPFIVGLQTRNISDFSVPSACQSKPPFIVNHLESSKLFRNLEGSGSKVVDAREQLEHAREELAREQLEQRSKQIFKKSLRLKTCEIRLKF